MKLLNKGSKWRWTRDHDEVLQQVKSLFINTVVLHHPRVGERFYLQTDAGNIAIGAHLYQIDEKGQKAVLGFVSRTLKGAELTYFTTEKELLAIVHSLSKFRSYILGAKLTIITDNKALVFLLKCKLLGARLTPWILAIQEYQFEIQYCKAKGNFVADVLSRNPPSENNMDTDNIKSSRMI